jgi:RHS repeat-associated protein
VTAGGEEANTRTYHYDFRGSTVAITDDTGRLTDRIDYDPYGEIAYRAGRTDTPFLYHGRYGVQTDANTLVQMGARYYSPRLCRFTSFDPAGFAGGLNWYAFAAGNPISYVDPSGLGPQSAGFSWVSQSFVSDHIAAQTRINALLQPQITAQDIFVGLLQWGGGAVNAAYNLTLGGLADSALGAGSAITGRNEYGQTLSGGQRAAAGGLALLVVTPVRAVTKPVSTVARAATQLHHPLPRFLGGHANQVLTPLPKNIHAEFHSLLRQNLREAGLPLNVGGRGGSAADWAQYFRQHSGAQRSALDAVLNTSREIDYRRGTQITRDVWRNLLEGKFNALP